MENLDIYILTSVVATLFIVFFVTMYREFSRMGKEGYEYDPKAKKYGRDALFNLAAKLFEDETIPKKEKKIIYRAMFRNMADMESDGVYFPDDVKKEIIKMREEHHCEYSGLPSPKFYESLQKINETI
jgi:hypothetical protein